MRWRKQQILHPVASMVRVSAERDRSRKEINSPVTELILCRPGAPGACQQVTRPLWYPDLRSKSSSFDEWQSCARRCEV
jgi:hypothetical protein